MRKSYTYILSLLSGIAVLSLLSSVLFQVHLGKPMDLYHVLDLSFYHLVPIILWVLVLIPLLHHLTLRFPVSGRDLKNLLVHVLISLALAPIIRTIAITLDFWVKSNIGMIDVPVLPLVYDVRWVILGSLPKAFFEYWLVAALLSYWHTTHTKTESGPVKHLILSSSSGSDIVPLGDILWIEADGNYVMIHTTNQAIRSRKTFKNLWLELTTNFIQVHRSKIINREAVSSLRHWRNGEYLITLVNGAYVTSTRTFLPNVRKLTV
ncbi:MAG: LytTR family DNA-binding domain-containing protein [Cyclobacteriaceae bacterium]